MFFKFLFWQSISVIGLSLIFEVENFFSFENVCGALYFPVQIFNNVQLST